MHQEAFSIIPPYEEVVENILNVNRQQYLSMVSCIDILQLTLASMIQSTSQVLTGILICFLFSTITLPAQSRLSNAIEMAYGIHLGYRTIGHSDFGEEVPTAYTNRSHGELFRKHHRFGLSYSHGLNDHWMLKIGVRIANPGFRTSSIAPIDPTTNIDHINKQPVREGVLYHYAYDIVELPLAARYVFYGNICEPFIELGVSPFYYRSTKVEGRSIGGSDLLGQWRIEDPIRQLNFSAYMASGGQYLLTRHLSLYIQLIGYYQLNDLRITAVNERLFSLGTEMGVRYHIFN